MADIQSYVTKCKITSAMSNPVRESAKTEKGDESSPMQAVMESEWAGVRLGAIKCGQVHTLRNEAEPS